MLKTGLLAVALATLSFAQKPLDIYFIDMEGGHSTLYVSPSGQSMLIDTGSPGDRDVDRIMAVLEAAGVKQIDYMVLSHYHSDHIGGLEALAKRIPIKHFVDHGASVEAREQVPGFQKIYADLYEKAPRMIAKPGDKVPVAGLDVTVVTSANQVIKKPIAGAPGAGKPNPACADFQPRDESRVDPDNPQSVGLVIANGKFRTINLADFTWNSERDLMCPNNPIGTIDLYLTSHHGIDQSGSPALVHGLRPRVAVMHNGTRKGGAASTYAALHSSPGLEDIWQLHWSWTGGLENNPAGVFIANLDDKETIANVIQNPPQPLQFGTGGRGAGAPGAPPAATTATAAAPPPGTGRGPGRGGHTGPAFWIKVSALPDGSFTVTNTRNGFTKSYGAK